MKAVYLIGLFIFLITEYGFHSRRSSLTIFSSRWEWKRAFLRSIMWLIYMGIAGWQRSWATFGVVCAFIVAGEIAVFFFRARMKSAIGDTHSYGEPWAHLLPFILALLFPAIMACASLIGRLQIVSTIFASNLRLLLIMNAVVILWSWSNLFVISVVETVRPGQVKKEIEPQVGAGEIIGILERYITFLLVVNGIGAVAGFVMAAKAAVRFPQFQHKEFAEYFLIGTLTSVGIAVLLALLTAN